MRLSVLILVSVGSLLAAAVGVVAFTPAGHPMLRSMFPAGEITPVVWNDVRLNNDPARYLVCPGYDLCTDLNDRTAIFDASIDRLMEEWERILAIDTEGMELVLSDDGAHQFTYLIHSAFLQLPDLVTVQFFAYNEDDDRPRSSLAIYSRRVDVAGDFGQNSQRVIGYLDHLERALGVYRR